MCSKVYKCVTSASENEAHIHPFEVLVVVAHLIS